MVAVEALGWRYEVCSDWPEGLLAYVRFLAGFRDPDRFDLDLLKAPTRGTLPGPR